MSSTFHSGKLGTVTVNGTELPTMSWRTNPTAEVVAFRNSKTGLFPAREATFRDLSGSVVIDFDFDNNPFASPVSLVPGQSITNLILYTHGTATDASKCVTVPKAIVTTTPLEVSIDGKIGLSFDWVTNGTFSLPGGITPTADTTNVLIP